MDTLICGGCQLSFHDLEEFVDHKNRGCEDTELKQDPKEEEQEVLLSDDKDAPTIFVLPDHDVNPKGVYHFVLKYVEKILQ